MHLLGRHYLTGEPVDVQIDAGRVAAVAPLDRTKRAGTPTDLPWIAPGFVDLQINGHGGQEFCSRELTPEKVDQIVRRQAEFGVTQLCPTVTTADFDTLAHSLRTIALACAQSEQLSRRVLGIHLEGPYISPHDGPRGAHPRAHCRRPDWDELQRLQEAAANRICLVTLSAEFDESPDFIAKLVESGVTAAIGHTAADSQQIRRAVDAGATLSTHLGNGAHLLLPRHPNYIWDQLADDRLTASLIVDGFHLPPAVVRSIVRAKSPNRIVLISDQSGLAGMPPGRYPSGLCDVEILDDGRLVVAGQRELLAAASLPIGTGIVNVMRFAGVDLPTAVDMASRNPLKLLRRNPSRLMLGDAADLVLFDVERSADGQPQRLAVRATVISGEAAFGTIP